jgi:hypothetical protein
MKHALLAGAILAFALTACGKKEEAPAPAPAAPAPAAAPSEPAAAPAGEAASATAAPEEKKQ